MSLEMLSKGPTTATRPQTRPAAPLSARRRTPPTRALFMFVTNYVTSPSPAVSAIASVRTSIQWYTVRRTLMREFPSSVEILKLFERDPEKTFRLRELVVELGLRSSQARELKHALKDLARRRKIAYLKKNHFVLVTRGRDDTVATRARVPHGAQAAEGERGPKPGALSTVIGRLIGHRDGYGFVVPERPGAASDQDIFIPPAGMGSAMHGDRVEVQVLRSKSDGRPGERPGGRFEGRVLAVRERAQKTVVGEFHCGARSNYVLPYDRRIPLEIIIPRGQERPAEGREAAGRNRQFGGESGGDAEGRGPKPRAGPPASARETEVTIVAAEITSFPSPGAPPRGRVLEILGRRADFG